MTPAQKLKMGKDIALDLKQRYEFLKSGEEEMNLWDILTSEEGNRLPKKPFKNFFSWSNPLYQKYEKSSVLRLLVEKDVIEKTDFENYVNIQSELVQCEEKLGAIVEETFQKTMGDMNPDQANQYKNILNQQQRGKRKKMQMVFDYLYVLKQKDKLSQEGSQILHHLESLEEQKDNLLEKLEALESIFLGRIKEMWKSGKLKYALLNHTPNKKKRKTTLARSIPINQLYPEKTHRQIEKETSYTATDIIGLDKITTKQFQALQFLAHKAQNQSDEERKMLEIWNDVSGENHRGFRVVAFKKSEYITHAQGKDSSMVSDKEKIACIKAIDELKDVKFTIRWEEKCKGKKEYILFQHGLIKTLNPNEPWTLVQEKKDLKEIKKFQFIAIPERLFEYQQIPYKEKKYAGAKVLFDVINIDPDFFTTLKYADPEIKHVSDALMRLSLIFLVEGSFGRTQFIIEEKKLLNRIGLTNNENRHMGRANHTLNVYIDKLINHGTLEAEEKEKNKWVFRLPKKDKNNEEN